MLIAGNRLGRMEVVMPMHGVASIPLHGNPAPRRPGALAGGLAACLALAVVYASPAGAAGGEQVHVGRAAAIVADVKGKLGEADPKTVIVNEKMFFEERLITTADSQGVVEFRDGSLLQLGPNSIVTLDRFVFNPFESKVENAITVVAGAFRFVSGIKSKSSVVQIRTPTATIGIRGSVVEGLVNPKGNFVFVREGVATLRNPAGVVQIPAGRGASVPSANVAPRQSEVRSIDAESVGFIASQIGDRPPPLAETTPELDQATAAANATPPDEQAAVQVEVPTDLPAAVEVAGAEAPPLLSQATDVGLFERPADAELTAEQTAFVAQAEAAVPDAEALIEAATALGEEVSEQNTDRSTGEVVAIAIEYAEDAEVVGVLVESLTSADPERAGIIVDSAIGAGGDPSLVVLSALNGGGAPTVVAAAAIGAGADPGQLEGLVDPTILAGLGFIEQLEPAAGDGDDDGDGDVVVLTPPVSESQILSTVELEAAAGVSPTQ